MGLDITICTDIDEQIILGDYYEKFFKKHSLSRTFCNLISRKDVVDGEPELDQIAKITSLDISPIHEMETYGSDNSEELEFLLEVASNEEERQKILEESEQKKGNLKDNLDRVLSTINLLIDKLSKVRDLSNMLNDSGYDTLDYKKYFTDFETDKGDGYIGNNFGQDLRNFKSFLEFAKDKGATTVYFSYG